VKHRQVVVDQSAIVAALDPAADLHSIVRIELLELLDRFERADVLLVTHTDAVTGAAAELAARGLPREVTDSVADLAEAFDVVVLHDDLRDDAREVMFTARDHGIDLSTTTALTVEVARRRGTRRILSVDPGLSALDLVVIPAVVLPGQISPA
jgi:predicted nucleic acid-binding protein